ncbi:hypothetical protein ACFE04_020996 [Oxalis oulophora]
MARGSLSFPNSPLPVSPTGYHTMYQSPRSELNSLKVDARRLLADQRAANITSSQDVVVISGDSSLQPAYSLGSVSGGCIGEPFKASDHQTARTNDNKAVRTSDNV